ncbi:hypothetical protein GIB67_007953 [Kingdonia uniflora]|uniref:Intermembrane lipid transfer protein VPS13-like C-terminal domain-containing protein n=1 Tax=Kingdonia uniflora TaxID=39325 RepID=A0A7J7LTS5_9MAGN|nr:hypothetical protein GIB67_007953 [Kingdonia uniflora]
MSKRLSSKQEVPVGVSTRVSARLHFQKPGRRLFVSIHAEGAVKVLSIIDSSCHIVKDITETGFRGLKDKKKPYQKHDVTAEYSERISVHISFVGISLINSNPQELLFASAKDIKIDVLQNLEQQKLSFKMSSLQIDNQLRNATYPVILHFDPESGSNSAMQIRNKDGSSRIKNKTAENSCEPVFSFSAAKWRNKEISPVSFEYISLRLADLCLELEEEVILSLLHLVRVVILRIENRTSFVDSAPPPVAQEYESANLSRSKLYSRNASNSVKGIEKSPSMPSVLPIGAPWQKIYLLARRQKKIYVEVLDLAPIKLTLSFSSAPWVNRTGGAASTESLAHVNGTAFQRGLMAFADVEGAPVYLKQLSIAHYMGSFESYQEILFRHYTRQLLHETYKVFGSAGVIGNPMGFARNLGLGIKDFLSVPARGMFQSPVGLITGMAQGTTSLFANTVYAVSNATTQFSKSAHKSIVAFTFEDQATYKLDKQHNSSHSNGVLNEFLEGLTGFLQSPIRGAEKHGLPGVFSGIALGTAGLVARPVASILEVTGKTAQSIRNRSSLHRPHHFRVRFPRPLNRETPLHPYSWEEAVGTSVLLEADNGKFKDETFVMCKALKKAGKFVTLTESLILVVTCPSLVGLGSPEFRGVSSDPEWTIEIEMGLECIIHVGKEEEVLNIVGTSSETLLKQQNKRGITSRTKWFSHSTSPPLFHTSMEFPSKDEAEDVLQVLLSTVEQGKERGLGVHVLHRRNLR